MIFQKLKNHLNIWLWVHMLLYSKASKIAKPGLLRWASKYLFLFTFCAKYSGKPKEFPSSWSL